MRPLRLYHFTNAVHGISDMKLRRLKIARIAELNDPFEMVGCDLSDARWRRIMRELKNTFDATIGMVCFSRTWSDPVQWGHYADKHKGICLGFDVDEDDVKQVVYVRSRAPIPFEIDIPTLGNTDMDVEDPPPPLPLLLYTKFAHWSYEDEFRVFAPLQSPVIDQDSGRRLYFLDFGPRLRLKEVIVGASSPLNELDIREALRGHEVDIKVTKARPAFKTFQMVKQNDVKFWNYPPEFDAP